MKQLRSRVQSHEDADAPDVELHDRDGRSVGTVEVQILLSWFFDTSSPGEFALDVRRAA